jgi:RHS repeat-associated protein
MLSNFYSFGSLLPGRKWSPASTDKYRFGFNGKEKDDEVNGDENSFAFEERIYDSRLGRYFSTDPRETEYGWQTPFAYFKNSPISTLDLLGGGGPFMDEPDKPEPTDNKPKTVDCSFSDLKFLYKIKAIASFTVHPFKYWGYKGGFQGCVHNICCPKDDGKNPLKTGVKRPFEDTFIGGIIENVKDKVNIVKFNFTSWVYKKTIQVQKFFADINVGLRIYDIVIFDIKGDAQKLNDTFFPGREKSDGSYSTARIQLFYNVHHGTSTHTHPLREIKQGIFHIFIWTKQFDIICAAIPSCYSVIDP